MAEHGKSDVVVILCTAPEGSGHTIASKLLDRHLVACVNILSARSVYRWEGAICDDPEDLLIMKTSHARVNELTSFLVSIHPYDIPEVICIPVHGGYERYLAWVDREVQ